MSDVCCTDAVVDFMVGARLERFPDDVVREGKRCVLDGLAVILAGSTAQSGAIVLRYLGAIDGTAESTVLGARPMKVPSALAALANGTAGHAHDYDDTQLSMYPGRMYGLLTHPTVPPLAAAFALGERLAATGSRVLEAFLVGVEVECKIAEAIEPDHYARGFHTSGTVGTFGAAAAAAKLLGLSRSAAAAAIGIAASSCSGIRVNFGTMTKPLHVGRAAENGVRAAELAALGYTASESALDGRWGFFEIFGGGFAPEVLERLGNPFTLADPGVSVKPYPCGVLGHPSMDAMLKVVVENDIEPEQIGVIRLRAASNILNPLRFRKARTGLEAKFCIPFMLSSIAIRRRAGLREFTDEFVSSAPVQEMMDRVECVHDAEIEARGYDRIRSVVEVELRDGRRFVQPSDDRYRGGPERPLSRDELHAKFRECAAGAIPEAQIVPALEGIESIDALARLDDLITALCAPAEDRR